MKLHSEHDASVLSMQLVDTESYDLSVKLQVTISDDGFSGSDDGIWFEMDAVEAFVTALRECERTRAGCASLSSMSPDEFELTVERADGLGHFNVHYCLRPYRYIGQRHTLAGTFEIDSEYFGRMAQGASDLLKAARAAVERDGA